MPVRSVKSGRRAVSIQRRFDFAASEFHLNAPHRPAYGSDGDYWSKPGREHVVHAVYDLMRESDPARFTLTAIERQSDPEPRSAAQW